ncbi:MAG: (2Fe-2S)-binding protein [Chloracidobacterium sp.]|nr:(2Fe-2S)-binding protein [Chloracidobacterium sp.]
MNTSDMFQPYDRLIEIEILGEARSVPENNSLLRCFQFLSIESISYGDFCWNGTCLNCQVWLRIGKKEKAVMACRTQVEEGMVVLRVADEIELSEPPA